MIILSTANAIGTLTSQRQKCNYRKNSGTGSRMKVGKNDGSDYR